MRLGLALDIGKECALETVGEAIYNVVLRAGQIFSYGEFNKELNQLHSEWDAIKSTTSFTDESSVLEVLDYLKSAGITHEDSVDNAECDSPPKSELNTEPVFDPKSVTTEPEGVEFSLDEMLQMANGKKMKFMDSFD